MYKEWNNIIAVTGHRPDKLNNDYSMHSELVVNIQLRLEAIIDKHKPDAMISGMALGIDKLWAKIVLYKEIPLILAIPFRGQELKWNEFDQSEYHSILDKAAEVVYVCDGGYEAWKLQKRNEWMVDHCELLVCVWCVDSLFDI